MDYNDYVKIPNEKITPIYGKTCFNNKPKLTLTYFKTIKAIR